MLGTRLAGAGAASQWQPGRRPPAALPAAACGFTPPYWAVMGATVITSAGRRSSSKWLMHHAYRHQRDSLREREISGPLTAVDPTAAASIWKHVTTVPLREVTLWERSCPARHVRRGCYRLGLAAHLPIVESTANPKVGSRWRCGHLCAAMLHHPAPPSAAARPVIDAIGAADDTRAIICRPPRSFDHSSERFVETSRRS